MIVFFFKQKTAYEMRISDWSSDVCSSDLAVLPLLSGGASTQAVQPALGCNAMCSVSKRSCPRSVTANNSVGVRGQRAVKSVQLKVSLRRVVFSDQPSLMRRSISAWVTASPNSAGARRALDCACRSEARRVGKEGGSTGRYGG